MSARDPSLEPARATPSPDAAEVWLRLRLRERPGSLERAIGLLRRRHAVPTRLEVTSVDGRLEVLARVRLGRITADRLRRELHALQDAYHVEVGGPPPAEDSGG